MNGTGDGYTGNHGLYHGSTSHTQRHIHTDTYTHRHTQKDTQTHTHTHTQYDKRELPVRARKCGYNQYHA